MKVTGPVEQGSYGWPFGAYNGDMKRFHYVEEEYFIEGEASHYEPEGELARDGMWTLRERRKTPYKTRFLVRRPLDSSRFNGTVVVEWGNTSFGYEISLCDSNELYRNGFAYVLASVQPAGLYGYEKKKTGMRDWDGKRYGDLMIDSDGASYDIYTQIASAVRHGDENGRRPMMDLEVKWMIAAGASQSGTRVQAYANGIQPMTRCFDAFIPAVHAWAASDFMDEAGHPDSSLGKKGHSRHLFCKIRPDLKTPVVGISTQTEVLGAGWRPGKSGRDDIWEEENVYSWEIAGASHIAAMHWKMLNQKSDRDGLSDSLAVFDPYPVDEVDWLPTFVMAVFQIHDRLENRIPIRRYELIQTDENGYIYDEHGNVKGGIRLPELVVPTARYVAGPTLRHGGYTIRFPEEKLKQMYPAHEDYVEKVRSAAEKACEERVISEERKEIYVKMAEAAPVPVTLMPDLTPVIRK